MQETLDVKIEDAKELLELIKKLPDDKRREVLALIRGYVLCAENDEMAG